MTVPDAVRWPGQDHGRLAEAVGYADVVLGAVDERLLSSPTPCRAWNLRMLLEHADDSLAVLLEGLTAARIAPYPVPPPASGVSSADLVGAFRRRAVALLRASAQADDGMPVAVGSYSLQAECLRTVGILEVAVHSWDISQACGQRLPIPEGLAAYLLTQVGLLVPRDGREPMFAQPAPAPAGAASGERLIAYLGRSVCPA